VKYTRERMMIPLNLRFFAEGQDGEKTEQPTAKKRSDARKEGQVAKSQEVGTAVMLITMFFALRLFGGMLYRNLVAIFFYDWSYIRYTGFSEFFELGFAANYVAFLFQQVLLVAAPLLAISVIVGLVTNLVQVGWHPTSKPLKPKLSHFNPIKGFKKIFSMQTIVNLVKSLAKFAVVGGVVFNMIRGRLDMIPMIVDMEVIAAVGFFSNMIIDLGLAVGGIFIFIALADYIYTRYSHTKKLKMTKHEVKEEYKQQEGNPQIKGKIRQKMREVSMRRMMQSVPEADVIITNPTHFAVALRYNNMIDDAPIVVAKGVDFVAKRIKEVAREHNIVVVENPPLARALYADVEVDQAIPFELWEAVVEVLAYVFKLKGKM